MNSETLYYWEYSFDLVQAKLSAYYKGSRTAAYAEVGAYLRKHGFDDENLKQGSCYFTSVPMPYLQVDKIIRRLYQDLPWLVECVRKDALMERPLDFVGYTYNDYREKRRNSKKHQLAMSNYLKQEKEPLDSRLNDAKEMINKANNPTKSKRIMKTISYHTK